MLHFMCILFWGAGNKAREEDEFHWSIYFISLHSFTFLKLLVFDFFFYIVYSAPVLFAIDRKILVEQVWQTLSDNK